MSSEEQKKQQEIERRIQEQARREKESQIRRDEELRRIKEQQINERKQTEDIVKGKPTGGRPKKDD